MSANEGPSKSDWQESRKLPECGAHCEHVHGDQADADIPVIDSLKRQVADLHQTLAANAAAISRIIAERDSAIASEAAVRRERDSLRLEREALIRGAGALADRVEHEEREACAVEAEKWLNRPRCKAAALDIARAIRARGDA